MTDYITSRLMVTESVENSVQSDPSVSLAFPMIASSGGADSRKIAVDINAFRCVEGHENGSLLG